MPKLSSLIRETMLLEEKKKNLQEKISEKRNIIQSVLRKKKLDKIQVDDISATRVLRVTVEYDAEKLIENLKNNNKESLIDDVVDKSYELKENAISEMIDFLKSYGVKIKEFKKFISVNKKINKKAIDELFDQGEIDEKDLEGATEIKEKESLRMVRSERNS